MNKLQQAIKYSLINCIGIKRKEKVLVVTDKPLRKTGYVFFESAIELQTEASIIEIKPRLIHGEEPPKAVAEAMKNVDVLILVTSKSLSHTKARRNACRLGARCASLPGITEDIIKRTFIADYSNISKKANKLSNILTNGTMVTIKTPAGTNISFSINGRKGFADTGIVKKPGSFTNLPAGEAYIAPVEKTANGIIVIDGSLPFCGKIKHNIKLYVINGYVIDIKENKNDSKKLADILFNMYSKNARNIAEFGIGVNNKAIITGNTLEDEKTINTVHVAIGNNKSFGGNVDVPIHLDAVLLNPTVIIDNKTIEIK